MYVLCITNSNLVLRIRRQMEEMAPLIYTPTVAQACSDFGMRFRRPRGMYFTPEDRGQMSASKWLVAVPMMQHGCDLLFLMSVVVLMCSGI